jgi:DNA-binding SARP family transcriptional activator
VLAEALALWRGQPLAGLSGRWVAQVRDYWHRYRLDAVVHCAQLRLGRPGAAIAILPAFVAEYPLAEPLEALLMQALHAAGRDAAALDRYTAVRQRLSNDLAADPGSELQSLYRAILCGEMPTPPAATEVVAPPRHVASPSQLPPDLSSRTR